MEDVNLVYIASYYLLWSKHEVTHIMEVLTICLICYSASMKSHAIWRAAHDIEGVNLAYDSLVWIDFWQVKRLFYKLNLLYFDLCTKLFFPF